MHHPCYIILVMFTLSPHPAFGFTVIARTGIVFAGTLAHCRDFIARVEGRVLPFRPCPRRRTGRSSRVVAGATVITAA